MSNNELKVSLRVVGDELSPEEITRILGCQPTECRKKGDEIESKRFIRKAPTGVWLLRSNGASTIDDAVSSLLDQVSNDPSVWQKLTKQFRAEFFVGIFSGTTQVGITLTASTIQRLSELGLSMGLDVYCNAEASSATT